MCKKNLIRIINTYLHNPQFDISNVESIYKSAKEFFKNLKLIDCNISNKILFFTLLIYNRLTNSWIKPQKAEIFYYPANVKNDQIKQWWKNDQENREKLKIKASVRDIVYSKIIPEKENTQRSGLLIKKNNRFAYAYDEANDLITITIKTMSETDDAIKMFLEGTLKNQEYFKSLEDKDRRDFLYSLISIISVIKDAKCIYYQPVHIVGKHPSSGISIFLKENLESDEVELLKLLVSAFFIHNEIEQNHLISRKHALRSAVAAIMIRNFAHHHGSHVIPRIKKNMDGIEEYLQYINEKTALLNIINIYDPISEGKVNLNDTLKYLNENKGAKLFRKFFAEASCRENVWVNGPKCDEELIISPGYGEIGVHAIYIIFENYARNVLKHCKPRSDDKEAENGPTIQFSVKKDNTDVIIEIKSDYIVDSIDEKVNDINDIIENSEIIDAEGKTDFDNPGIKEMQICANILIGRNLGLPGKENLEAFKDGEELGYRFKIPLAKYVDKGDRGTINEISSGKKVKPDFLVVNLEDIDFILQNWDVLPQKLCWLGNERDLNLNKDESMKRWEDWIKKRSIFITEDEYNGCGSEQGKYSLLLEKWWEKIFKDRGIVIKFCDKVNKKWQEAWQMEYWNKIEQLINCRENAIAPEFHFSHSEECNHSNAVKLVFHHEPSYRIFRYFGSKCSPLLKNADDVKKKIVDLEICSILAFKILIIDNELHDKFESELRKLKEINIFVVSEDKDNFHDLKDYDCVVFHLGMLDVKEGLYDIKPGNLPPYIRIVTGRAKPLSKEILLKCLWANSRQIDRSVFIRALKANDNDILEKKYKVFWGVLK